VLSTAAGLAAGIASNDGVILPSGIVLPGTRSRFDQVAHASDLPRVPEANAPLKHTNIAPSRVIKGCWQLSGGHSGDAASDRTSGSAAVEDFAAFVAAGVTTFDTGPEACGYGPSELVIGEALRRGLVKREEVQVFTKMCCVGREQGNMTREWVNQKLDLPRKRLGVERLDLVQLYWNDYGQKHYVDCALFLTDAKHRGVINAVGVTNFDTKRVAEMVDAGAEISSNQIQFSLLDRRPELKMVEYCARNGIGLLPYGVVAGGLLSDKFLALPGEDVALDTSSKRKYASVLGYAGGYPWFQSLLATLKAVGEKHGGVSIANVASKWVLDSEAVPAVILGARNAEHVDDHRALFSFDLDEDDRMQIRAVLDEGKKPKEDCYQYDRGGGW
jgi:aryl-alcohol dehydrogenase-like predicted oxidoreductase